MEVEVEVEVVMMEVEAVVEVVMMEVQSWNWWWR